ncbi:MAG: hypothetical protein JWO32_1129 [Bacteroidetes bacterium]|nr:hypothetical protein [Bacteroidota bacterium]
MKFQKLRITLIPLVFLLIISFPFVNDRLHVILDIKSFENRRLAAQPHLDLKNLDPFPSAYEKFYNDTFSLRSRMVRAYSIYNLSVFKKSPCPDIVIIGNDGWLFLQGPEFDTYTGKNPLTQKELNDFKKELEYRQNYLAKRNCKFYFLIAPAKPNIYPEKVPFENLKMRELSMGEELLAFLEKNSSVPIVNLYSNLKEKKKEYRTYYALDNHWSRMGAFFSMKQFLSQVNKELPQVTPLSLDEYKITERDSTTGNTVRILGDLNYYHDVNYVLTGKKKPLAVDGKKTEYVPVKDFPYPWGYEEVKEIPGSTKPKILIISDSFGEYIFSLLAESFSKTVKIWDNWEYKLNEPIVENEKPDVCLLVIHEKNLRAILKNGSSFKSQ